MIKKRTVFVLGAGASIPYGLPSGTELLHTLYNASSSLTSELAEGLRINAQIAPEQTLQFAQALRYSNVNSVDTFLSKRTEFSEVGKLAIAYELCRREIPELIYDPRNEDNWYKFVWNYMLADTNNLTSINTNQVRFLTFNYDRSLEYFFFQSIKHTFNISDSEALAVVKKLLILHAYGSLGEFGFDDSENRRAYGSGMSSRSLTISAKTIRVIPQSRSDDKCFSIAQKWFHWAEQICFLGFGFDNLNVQRLGLATVLADSQRKANGPLSIVASGLGFTDTEGEAIRERVCPDGNSAWRFCRRRSLDVMRETGVLR